MKVKLTKLIKEQNYSDKHNGIETRLLITVNYDTVTEEITPDTVIAETSPLYKVDRVVTHSAPVTVCNITPLLPQLPALADVDWTEEIIEFNQSLRRVA